jgi:hypothetical protein
MAYTGALDMIYNGQEVIIKLGPFLDEIDSKTPLSALTITPADVFLSKNNGTLTQKNQEDNAVYDKKGYYDIKLNNIDTTIEVTDLNTLLVVVQMTGALPVWKNYRVSPFAPA